MADFRSSASESGSDNIQYVRLCVGPSGPLWRRQGYCGGVEDVELPLEPDPELPEVDPFGEVVEEPSVDPLFFLWCLWCFVVCVEFIELSVLPVLFVLEPG